MGSEPLGGVLVYSHQLTVHTELEGGVGAELTRNREAPVIEDVEPSERLGPPNPPTNLSIHMAKCRERYGVGGQVCRHELDARRRAIVAEEALAPGQELARGPMAAGHGVPVEAVVWGIFRLVYAGHYEE